MEAGGLVIVGSERHESRRIDNQLRGRAGRQGDVGETKFYISFEDDLMKLFGADKLQMLTSIMKFPDDMPIEAKMLNNAIETAQKRIEGIHYSSRKNILEYDDVVNKQREIIYSQRSNVLDVENIDDVVMPMVKTLIEENISRYFNSEENVNIQDINDMLNSIFNVEEIINEKEIEGLEQEEIQEYILKKINSIYQDKKKNMEEKNILPEYINLLRQLILHVVDEKWIDHIGNISALKDGINLRAYGQVNPLEAYKMESFAMFSELIQSIKEDSVKSVFSVKDAVTNKEKVIKEDIVIINKDSNTSVKSKKEQNRNDLCSCGSGKKYKHCCGK